MKTIVLLANGVPPSHAVPRRVLSDASVLICCDGACTKARAFGRAPDWVVGDGDSIPSDERRSLGSRFVADAEQNTNDLCKAFRLARRLAGRETVRLAILGATGLREDHTIGNIFHLPDFAADIPDTTIYTDAGTFVAVLGTRTFTCRPNDAVSVFAPQPGTHATSVGLKWPLDGVDLAPLWAGTLNRATGDQFTVRTDHPLLVYRPYDQ